MGAAGLGERRLELAEGLLGDAVADTVVLLDRDVVLLLRLGVDHLGPDGDNLVLELARSLGAGGALERLGGEGVLLLARDVVLGGDVLTCARRGGGMVRM